MRDRGVRLDHELVERGWALVIADALEPGAEQSVVVVAGDEHDVTVRECLPTASKKLAGLAERLADRTVAQLDDVAEQDEPLDAGASSLEEPLPHRRPAQDV